MEGNVSGLCSRIESDITFHSILIQRGFCIMVIIVFESFP